MAVAGSTLTVKKIASKWVQKYPKSHIRMGDFLTIWKFIIVCIIEHLLENKKVHLKYFGTFYPKTKKVRKMSTSILESIGVSKKKAAYISVKPGKRIRWVHSIFLKRLLVNDENEFKKWVEFKKSEELEV